MPNVTSRGAIPPICYTDADFGHARSLDCADPDPWDGMRRHSIGPLNLATVIVMTVGLTYSGVPGRSGTGPQADLPEAGTQNQPLETEEPIQPLRTDRPGYVLSAGGDLLKWVPGSTGLKPVSEIAGRFTALATVGNGNRILLLSAEPAAKKVKRKTREGAGILLDVSGADPIPLVEIRFRGMGVRAVAEPGGRLAYILASRPGEEDNPRGSGQWVHEVDLGSGQVIDSSGLQQIPWDIAIEPDGGRLLLSLPDRILTYTTEPLVTSWHYRSPGQNLGMAMRDDGVLHVARGREIALFDRKIINARSVEERTRINDDASSITPLPLDAAALIFSSDPHLAAAFGGAAEVVFIDPLEGRVLDPIEQPSRPVGTTSLLPVRFLGDGGLLMAALPVNVPLIWHGPRPTTAPPVIMADGGTLERTGLQGQAAETPPPGTPVIGATGTSAAATGAPEGPTVEPEWSPEKRVADEGKTPPPPVIPPEGSVIQGKVTGAVELLATVVVYGPDSIISELARITPDADGWWVISLDRPGRYRIMPLGAGSGPLGSKPNFQTVAVTKGEIRTGVDFEILGQP